MNVGPLLKTPEHLKRQDSNHLSLLVSIILIFLALIYGIYVWNMHVHSELFTIQFHKDATRQLNAVRTSLAAHIKTTKTLGAFFNHAHRITREEFNLFADSLSQTSPNMQALAWAPKVPLAERNEFEQGEIEAISGFQITEIDKNGFLVKAATHTDYYPVYYIEPYATYEPALGFDLASTESNRNVMNQVADSGQLAMIPHAAFFPGREKENILLTFYPIYHLGVWPKDRAQRRKTLKGFVMAVSEIGSMLERAIKQADIPGLDVWIFGAPHGREERLLFTSRANNSAASIHPLTSSDFHYEQIFDMGGYQWRIISAPLITTPVIHHPTYYYLQLGLLGAFIFGVGLLHIRQIQRNASSLKKAKISLNSAVSRLRENESTLKNHQRDLTNAYEQANLERTRLADAIESVDSAIAIFDADECLINCNSKFLNTYPEIRDKISHGISYKTLLEEYFSAANLNSLTNKSRDAWVDIWLNNFRQHQNGVVTQYNDVWLLISDYLTSEGGTVSLRSDITPIKNAEIEIQALNRTHSLLSRSSISLAKAADEQSLLSTFCENATRIGGYHTSMVLYAPNDDATSIQLKAISVSGDKDSAEMKNTDPHKSPLDTSLSEIAIDTQQTVVMNNLKDKNYEASSTTQNTPPVYQSMIAFPLKVDAAVIGCFSIYSTEQNSFNEQEQKLLQELAEILYSGIATMRARAAREQRRLQFKNEVEKNERKRIAATLHDGVAQTMQAVNLNLKSMRTLVRQEQELPPELLNSIIGSVEVTINDLREISHNLRPVFLEKMGIVDAIRHHCSELSAQGEIVIHVSGDVQNSELNPVSKEQCFISFREALNNALKHAGATHIDVVFENRAPGLFSIQIRDNGRGFNIDHDLRRPSGLGLSMMSERMQSVSGEAEIISSSDKGTIVKLTVPTAYLI